jgi:hypothetical protein
VGNPRRLLKTVTALFLTACIFFLLFFATSQIEQHLLRRRSERLLSEIQSLELRKTSWDAAEKAFEHWGANRHFDDACTQHACSFTVLLDDPSWHHMSERNLFSKLDDYFRWRFNLSYGEDGPFWRLSMALFHTYMRIGGHPAIITAKVGMIDGVVWSKGIDVRIETYVSPSSSNSASSEYTLMAEVRSVPRFESLGSLYGDGQLALHPDYAIGRPGGCESCILGWAKFTPNAATEDVNRMLRIDFSCLTRWHPCLDPQDLMPAAWTQFTAEHRQ